MMIGIFQDFRHNDNKFVETYCEILNINKINYKLIDYNDPKNLWKELENVSHLIFRFGQYDDEKHFASSIMPVLYSRHHIRCFPDFNTCWHYDNKIAQFYLLEANGFPVVETGVFWNRGKAIEYINNTTYPVVVKLSSGAGSSNVKMLNNHREAKHLTDRLFSNGYSSLDFQYGNKPWSLSFLKYKLRSFFISDPDSWLLHKNYILIQKFLPDNPFDTRVVTIGKRAIGFIRYNRPQDFRASGSGIFNLDPELVNKKCLKIAFEVSEKLGFQSMAYDFLVDENDEPLICEISYTFAFGKPYTDCPGYWDDNLNWHEGKNWPEYFQLVDFLEKKDLIRLEVK